MKVSLRLRLRVLGLNYSHFRPLPWLLSSPSWLPALTWPSLLSPTSVEHLTEFTTPLLTMPSTTPLWFTTPPLSIMLSTLSCTTPLSTTPPPTDTPPQPTDTTLTHMRHQSTTVQFKMLLSLSRSVPQLSRPSATQSSSPSRRSLTVRCATPSPEPSAKSASRSSRTRSAPTPTPRRPRTLPPRPLSSPSRGSATPRW